MSRGPFFRDSLFAASSNNSTRETCPFSDHAPKISGKQFMSVGLRYILWGIVFSFSGYRLTMYLIAPLVHSNNLIKYLAAQHAMIFCRSLIEYYSTHAAFRCPTENQFPTLKPCLVSTATNLHGDVSSSQAQQSQNISPRSKRPEQAK